MKIAFYKGRKRLFNILVSWWTNGPYSHVELVLGTTETGRYVCGSSSNLDGGVRIKEMALPADVWDVFDIDVGDPATACAWFMTHKGEAYDYIGLFGFVLRRGTQDQRRWFCSEAVGAALGLSEPWRHDPNTLKAIVKGN